MGSCPAGRNGRSARARRSAHRGVLSGRHDESSARACVRRRESWGAVPAGRFRSARRVRAGARIHRPGRPRESWGPVPPGSLDATGAGARERASWVLSCPGPCCHQARARRCATWGAVRRSTERPWNGPARVRRAHHGVLSAVRRAHHGVLSAMLGPMTKPTRPRCGARCRSKGGAPCSAPVVKVAGRLRARCRLHGGLSTGPRTPEGLERSRAAVFARWARWREERSTDMMRHTP